MKLASKDNINYTYSANENYWAPLSSDDEDDDEWMASTMVLDSGATSSFVRPEENLSITGPSDKIVALPDGSTKRATLTAILPFDALSDEARKADVLPGLRPNSLVSVGKLADANYTTVFHPRGEGVTIHKRNTLKLHLLCKPVL